MASAEYWNAYDEYADKFGEGFPRMCFVGSEPEAIAEMRSCIARGEPYDPYEGIPGDERSEVVF